MPPTADIETRADCEALVRAFYGRALTDPVIGFLFTDIAKLDLEEHVPRITNFWATILLGARTYGGGAFRPHLELNLQVPLKRGHFERWLYLWRATVNERFSGEHAELAISHAERVAGAFLRRLEDFNAQSGFAAGVGSGAAGLEVIGAAGGPVELPIVQRYEHGSQE